MRRLMNKKTFTVALLFLCLTLVWLVINLIWFMQDGKWSEIVVPVLLVVAGVYMVYSEFHKRKRRHIEEVKKYLK